MSDLKHHYKEILPEETIQNILNFFESKNLTVKEIVSFHSEIDTYSCAYALYFDNYEILTANGKGMTPIYCKASGLAELYERFCRYYNYFNFHPIIYDKLIDKSKCLAGTSL